MSRAYCLTCNEQVHETPSGTCPMGHPVTAHDEGPEPWVGFAGDGEVDAADHQAAVGEDELRVVHVGQRVEGGLDGHVNGTNGHVRPPEVAHVTRAATPTPPADAPPAEDDDLAALLAQALAGETDPSPDVDAPAPAAPETDPASPTDDHDELLGLAAELQLDQPDRVDDGPAPAANLDEASIDATDLDALLAELTRSPEPEAEPAPPPPPPVTDLAPPAPDVVAAPPNLPEAPEGLAPAPEDVPSAAPVDDLADLWAEPAPDASDDVAVDAFDEQDAYDGYDELDRPEDVASPSGAPVDLTNFTARGKRVGEGGSGTTRRTRRWKR